MARLGFFVLGIRPRARLLVGVIVVIGRRPSLTTLKGGLLGLSMLGILPSRTPLVLIQECRTIWVTIGIPGLSIFLGMGCHPMGTASVLFLQNL